MNNPKVMAVVTGIAAAWLIYGVATDAETPSSALAWLQYLLIAGCLIGFFGALKQIFSAKE